MTTKGNSNPGNFANDREKASEAGKKGGHASGGNLGKKGGQHSHGGQGRS